MNVLQEILRSKREEIARRKREAPLAPARAEPPAFAQALKSAPVGLIAEVKRRSPSAGPLREPFDAPAIARAYRDGGAQAISVLADEKYFGGGEEVFKSVRASVNLPLLYKEFVVDEWQVARAASLGASAVLLIVAALDDAQLGDLHSAIVDAGLAALVEVHDERETERALKLGAACIGVNNRDLRSFKTSLDTTFRLRGLVPDGVLFVSESGIRGAEDVRRLKDAGVDAVLVGEHLLRKPDLGAAVRELMGAVWASS